MNTHVIMYEDLEDDEMLVSSMTINYTISLLGHQLVVPRRTEIYSNKYDTWLVAGKLTTHLTPPMQFIEMKLAEKLSMRCQLRCNCCHEVSE